MQKLDQDILNIRNFLEENVRKILKYLLKVGGGAALDALARASQWQRALAAWWLLRPSPYCPL